MRWTVRFKNDALRELLDLPKPISFRVGEKIALLEEEPFPAGSRKLKNLPHFYRLRVGDYRVLYQIEPSERLIRIFRVRHRRDAYRGLW